ncbi:hypothetical protein LRS13_15690 [Svornostia abyssi]|uniref:Uncharacterized protein n=1 Tax=Svornostia abyssi TaxID=2898438 RepID=A0ABY5PC09_9ACTN|nr:hypothetical protein LRS13_15690 [Parviterribacteraceae bacterium J379]
MPSEIEMVFSSIGVPPGGADALFDLRGERTLVEVARHRLDPAVGDRHDGLGERLVVEADAFEVGAGECPFGPFEQRAAAVLDVEAGGAHGAQPTSRSGA